MIVNEFELERLEPYLKKFNLEQLKAPPAVYHLKWTGICLENQITKFLSPMRAKENAKSILILLTPNNRSP